jgi:DNA repair protein RadC
MENEKKKPNPIKDWSIDDRPREKLQQKGPGSLSNSELLGILIGSGSPEKSAVALAREVMELSKNNLEDLGKLSLKEIQQVKGIGVARAIIIAAALELGRRREAGSSRQKMRFKSSGEIARYLKALLKDKNSEHFVVIYLNQSNSLLCHKIISSGGITGTVADPRIILKTALEESATSIILSHNHPSGNLKPSIADEQLTQKIKQAAALMDIKILDHLIITNDGYFSFADQGLL